MPLTPQAQAISDEFMTKLVNGFKRDAIRYMEAVNEPSFAHSEKQLSGLLIPTASRISSAFLAEYPLKRTRSRTDNDGQRSDGHGWVDYWCRYKNYDFMIELKHHVMDVGSSRVTSNVTRGWQTLHKEQLKNIRKEAKWLAKFSSGTIPVALHIVTFKARPGGDYSMDWKSAESMFANLTPSPNWTKLWKLSMNQVEMSHYNGFAHPAVFFSVWFGDLIKPAAKSKNN